MVPKSAKPSSKNSNSENRFVAEPINVSKNLFNMLEHNESNSIHFDIDDEPITTKNLTEIQNHVKLQNVKRRPPVVVNQNPEKRTVPGESLYSEAVKNKPNNQNIKIFSDSIAKGIRIRQLNQFVKSGNARIHSFPGANSKQLLHYLDVKDGLHLLDSGKRILANNFIFNLNNFLCQIQQPVLLT